MYWDSVLNEVLNKNTVEYPFMFTNVGEVRERAPGELDEDASDKGARKKRCYYLTRGAHKQYLTRREAECMVHLLRGKTVPSAAKAMNLSSRTVEYYVKNMKARLACPSKEALIEKVLKSDFLNEVDFL